MAQTLLSAGVRVHNTRGAPSARITTVPHRRQESCGTVQSGRSPPGFQTQFHVTTSHSTKGYMQLSHGGVAGGIPPWVVVLVIRSWESPSWIKLVYLLFTSGGHTAYAYMPG